MGYTCRSCSEHDLDVRLCSSECAELHPPPRQPGGYYHREMTGQLNMGISALISLGVLTSQVTKDCPITLA